MRSEEFLKWLCVLVIVIALVYFLYYLAHHPA